MQFDPAISEVFATAVNDTNHPITYLGIDPGESNGVAGFDESFRLVFQYTVMYADLIDFLCLFKKLKLIVCEDFFLYPDKAMQQVYSDMKTSKAIGHVESYVRTYKVELEMQKATIKKNAYKWIGVKPPSKSNPRNHEMDAHVHFMYWAIKAGKINANSLL